MKNIQIASCFAIQILYFFLPSSSLLPYPFLRVQIEIKVLRCTYGWFTFICKVSIFFIFFRILVNVVRVCKDRFKMFWGPIQLHFVIKKYLPRIATGRHSKVHRRSVWTYLKTRNAMRSSNLMHRTWTKSRSLSTRAFTLHVVHVLSANVCLRYCFICV